MINKIELGIGVFILLAAIGVTYTLTNIEGYETYDCEGIVGYCWRIDDSPTYGKDVICRTDKNNSRKYKRCLNGWKLYSGENVTGTIIDLPDYIEISLSEKQLLEKKGIVSPVVSSCKRISESQCQFKVTNGFNKDFEIELYDEIFNNETNSTDKVWKTNSVIDAEVIFIYNNLINNTINEQQNREIKKVEKEFYANQSYGTEKIVIIE